MAHQIAYHLEQTGEKIAYLGIVDGYVPLEYEHFHDNFSIKEYLKSIYDSLKDQFLDVPFIDFEKFETYSTNEMIKQFLQSFKQSNMHYKEGAIKELKYTIQNIIFHHQLLVSNRYENNQLVLQAPCYLYSISQELRQENTITQVEQIKGWEMACSKEFYVRHLVEGTHEQLLNEPYVTGLSELIKADLLQSNRNSDVV